MKKKSTAEMKKEYDFSRAERGKFHSPAEEPDIPIYLDKKVREYYGKLAARGKTNIARIINRVLREDMESRKELGLK
jgi:hypothetical protein